MSQCQARPPRSQLENRQATNRTTAIIVPALLFGIVGYVTWVVVVLIGGECCLCLMAEESRTREEILDPKDKESNTLIDSSLPSSSLVNIENL